MGTCVFCGRDCETVPVRFPRTFTAYQLLQDGDGGCERCRVMLKDPVFRRNSWVIQGGSFEVVEDPVGFLLDPPQPPFLVYLTRTRRKHGWILAVRNRVLSRESFILVVDEEKFLFDRGRFTWMVRFAADLKARGVPRRVLLAGTVTASTARKYGLSRFEVEKLRLLKGNKLWGVAAFWIGKWKGLSTSC